MVLFVVHSIALGNEIEVFGKCKLLLDNKYFSHILTHLRSENKVFKEMVGFVNVTDNVDVVKNILSNANMGSVYLGGIYVVDIMIPELLVTGLLGSEPPGQVQAFNNFLELIEKGRENRSWRTLSLYQDNLNILVENLKRGIFDELRYKDIIDHNSGKILIPNPLDSTEAQRKQYQEYGFAKIEYVANLSNIASNYEEYLDGILTVIEAIKTRNISIGTGDAYEALWSKLLTLYHRANLEYWDILTEAFKTFPSVDFNQEERVIERIAQHKKLNYFPKEKDNTVYNFFVQYSGNIPQWKFRKIDLDNVRK